MTKCLITGGAGFIGSHLVEACLERRAKVIVLDDLSTGKREYLPSGRPDLELIEGGITDPKLLQEIKAKNPDLEYIFHLAAIASVPRSMEEPLHCHKTNFKGTLLLLECFKGCRIKKFVYASSAAVYGEPGRIPIREDAIPSPTSPYGADKLQGEYYLKIYNDSFDLPTVSCRFFNVFGERQDPSSSYSGVISLFFDRALAKKGGEETAITIYGNGEQTRDFIYVKDIVRALLYLAEEDEIRGEVFNIGYGKEITIRALAETIHHLLNVDIGIVFGQTRKGDVFRSQAEITKLMKTGFQFRYDFRTGLSRLAKSLSKNL